MENFADLAKNYVLWESQRGGNVELMLQRSPTNSRVNELMSRWIMAFTRITENWKGKYKNMWSNIPNELQDHYLNMEAYSRKQAIELASAIARANAPIATDGSENKKPGGILGLFRR